VVQAVARTGTTVTSAGIILGGTLAVLVVSASGKEGSQIRPIGVGLAVGILMDAFLVRTLLVPATVILLGCCNWWPSAMSRSADSAAPKVRPLHHELQAEPPELRS
jgi:putative drug exporter of the RND superfamily